NAASDDNALNPARITTSAAHHSARVLDSVVMRCSPTTVWHDSIEFGLRLGGPPLQSILSLDEVEMSTKRADSAMGLHYASLIAETRRFLGSRLNGVGSRSASAHSSCPRLDSISLPRRVSIAWFDPASVGLSLLAGSGVRRTRRDQRRRGKG